MKTNKITAHVAERSFTMKNFDTKAFMDSLSEDMRQKVSACSTAEELTALIKGENIDLTAFGTFDEDTELSLDDLDGVAGGIGFLSSAAAAIIMFTNPSTATSTVASVSEMPDFAPSAYTQEYVHEDTASDFVIIDDSSADPGRQTGSVRMAGALP